MDIRIFFYSVGYLCVPCRAVVVVVVGQVSVSAVWPAGCRNHASGVCELDARAQPGRWGCRVWGPRADRVGRWASGRPGSRAEMTDSEWGSFVHTVQCSTTRASSRSPSRYFLSRMRRAPFPAHQRRATTSWWRGRAGWVTVVWWGRGTGRRGRRRSRRRRADRGRVLGRRARRRRRVHATRSRQRHSAAGDRYRRTGRPQWQRWSEPRTECSTLSETNNKQHSFTATRTHARRTLWRSS